MYANMCANMRACARVSRHVYPSVSAQVCMPKRACLRSVCMHKRACEHANMRVCCTCACLFACMCAHACACVRTHASVHACAHTRKCACIRV